MMGLLFRAFVDFNNEFVFWDSESSLFVGKSECFSWEYVKSCFNIEQYTGHKDKNGERIYNGDIVRVEESNYLIKWAGYCDGEYVESVECWMLIDENRGYLDASLSNAIYNDGVIEVIGDIHRTPELLEVVK